MASSVLKASDLLINLSEEYQSYNKEIEWKNVKELKKARFRLLLNIIFNEYSKTIEEKIDNEEKSEQSLFETSCTDEDLLAAVSTSEIKQEQKEIPKPFKVDEDSLDYIPDTCHIANEFILPKELQNVRSVPEKKNEILQINGLDANKRKSKKTSPLQTHIQNENTPIHLISPQIRPNHIVLVNSSGDSSNGSPSILRRKKKKRSKDTTKLETKISNPPSSKENINKEANAKTSHITKVLQNADKKSQPKQEYDSFDEYNPYEDENAWKFANVPVRKKSEREKLKGFSCDACENYYKNVNLTDEELQNLLQKCSRHRSTVVPPPTSPKEMWELDITGPANKTQYGSPFKTRERRKLERDRQQKK